MLALHHLLGHMQVRVRVHLRVGHHRLPLSEPLRRHAVGPIGHHLILLRQLRRVRHQRHLLRKLPLQLPRQLHPFHLLHLHKLLVVLRLVVLLHVHQLLPLVELLKSLEMRCEVIPGGTLRGSCCSPPAG
jgi:hypothetical protein